MTDPNYNFTPATLAYREEVEAISETARLILLQMDDLIFQVEAMQKHSHLGDRYVAQFQIKEAKHLLREAHGFLRDEAQSGTVQR